MIAYDISFHTYCHDVSWKDCVKQFLFSNLQQHIPAHGHDPHPTKRWHMAAPWIVMIRLASNCGSIATSTWIPKPQNRAPKRHDFLHSQTVFFFLSETLSEAKSRKISELGENLWLNHWTHLDFLIFCGGFSQGVDNDVHFLSEKILKSQVRFIQSTMASVSSLHKAPLRMISPCPRAARTMASGCFALEAKQQKLYEDYWWHRTWYINIFCHQVFNWSLLKLHLREPGEHTKFIHPCQVCCMESKSHFDKLLLYTC